MVREVRRRISLVRDNPLGWEARPHWGAGVRRALSDPYVIIYAVADHDIVVLRILHGSRHIDAIMRGAPE